MHYLWKIQKQSGMPVLFIYISFYIQLTYSGFLVLTCITYLFFYYSYLKAHIVFLAFHHISLGIRMQIYNLWKWLSDSSVSFSISVSTLFLMEFMEPQAMMASPLKS